jgi:hypothetical protein
VKINEFYANPDCKSKQMTKHLTLKKNETGFALPVEIGKGSLLLLGFQQGERSLSRRKQKLVLLLTCRLHYIYIEPHVAHMTKVLGKPLISPYALG